MFVIFPAFQNIDDFETLDDGTKMPRELRKLIPMISDVLQKLLYSLLIISLHLMTVDKVIPNYNQIKSNRFIDCQFQLRL